jgi:hypothetical protein
MIEDFSEWLDLVPAIGSGNNQFDAWLDLVPVLDVGSQNLWPPHRRTFVSFVGILP